jgi:hypothetical protein
MSQQDSENSFKKLSSNTLIVLKRKLMNEISRTENNTPDAILRKYQAACKELMIRKDVKYSGPDPCPM